VERLLQLIHVAIAREEGHAQDQLDEDSPHGPDIHCCGVIPSTPEQLGRAVPSEGLGSSQSPDNPPRNNLASHLAPRVAKLARETEIRNLELAVRGDEQVVRFQILGRSETEAARPRPRFKTEQRLQHQNFEL
jgi:hypothetical protein